MSAVLTIERSVLIVVQDALENSTLEVIVYQGQLDIICDVVGTYHSITYAVFYINLYSPLSGNNKMCRENRIRTVIIVHGN